jgi:hypothetical protein
MLWILVMDFGTGREGEEEILKIIGEGSTHAQGEGTTRAEGDGSEFLNESGDGMEEEQPHESENDDCEDGSQGTGRDLIKRSGEVYIYIYIYIYIYMKTCSIHESVDDDALCGIYINDCFLILEL